jgi:4-amino-4-deoxy-L-arabinose transferase-like glycosyltransferase
VACFPALEFGVRSIIIIAVTDTVIFYLLSTRSTRVLRFGYGTLAFLVIVVTLVPLLINIWFVLWRYGLLNVR